MSRSIYLPVVINRPPKQAAQVDRMIKHCRDLDGTELVVLEDDDATSPQLVCANNAMWRGAQHMKGRAFIWLEADSVPFKSGWVAAISAAYKKTGKPFLMPDNSQWAKEDIASGIGVYPPDAWWLLPKTFPQLAWDAWVEKHMQPLIGRTRLIQHRYGKYFMGKAAPWEFPRDKAILDPEAMLFHKDGQQSLIDCFKDSPYVIDFNREIVTPTKVARPNAPLFRHGGDIGDVIAALPILRHMGGGDVVLFHDPTMPLGMCPRESLEGKRYEALKPLLEAQPYVYSVSWGKHVEGKNFRETPRPRFESLLERQARHAGAWPIDQSRWLTVGPVEAHNRIICCRSPRYHYDAFPWKEIYETYGDRLLFVGLPDEHKAFEATIGAPIEHHKTENFLEIAKIMAGAPQVIANQSSPLWVALGLGVKVIVEGYQRFPNTQIDRPGSLWVYNHEQGRVLHQALAQVRRATKLNEARAIS